MKTIAMVLCSALILGNVALTNSDDLPPSYKPSIHQIIVKQARVYNIDPLPLFKVAKCESSLNPKAWNKSDPNGGSKGALQFQTSTFYSNAKKLNIENPDIWSVEQQAQVAAYLFSTGHASAWSCNAKVNGKLK